MAQAKTRSKKKKVSRKVKSKKKTRSVSKKASKSRASVSRKKPAIKTKKSDIPLGQVEDYFGNIGVIAFTLKNSLSLGQTIQVNGHTTDLIQRVDSIQINHRPVQKGKKGDGIGIKVAVKCRKGDKIFRLP